MLDPLLRAHKDAALLPLARAIGVRLHPTTLTLISFAVGCACAALLLRGAYAAALVAWLGCRVLDGLDGTLARATGRQSDLGGYLDIVLDFFVYAAVPIALVAGLPIAGRAEFLALALLLGSFFVNSASWMYLAALAEKRGRGARATGEQTSVTMPTGLIEGTETVLFFSAFIVLPHLAVPLFGAMTALVLVTSLQRVGWAVRHLGSVAVRKVAGRR
jgi:phosphatidylglycerophosphate synthase